jgi:hypothetical protein
MTYSLDEKAAILAHEACRIWYGLNGDPTKPSWEGAPESVREVAIARAQFHKENPDLSDAVSHQKWVDEKTSEGWVYGIAKNPAASPPTHNCLLQFDELPLAEKMKTVVFRAMVLAVRKNAAPESAQAT